MRNRKTGLKVITTNPASRNATSVTRATGTFWRTIKGNVVVAVGVFLDNRCVTPSLNLLLCPRYVRSHLAGLALIPSVLLPLAAHSTEASSSGVWLTPRAMSIYGSRDQRAPAASYRLFLPKYLFFFFCFKRDRRDGRFVHEQIRDLISACVSYLPFNYSNTRPCICRSSLWKVNSFESWHFFYIVQFALATEIFPAITSSRSFEKNLRRNFFLSSLSLEWKPISTWVLDTKFTCISRNCAEKVRW